ncbi:MAG: hypothetical protein M1824_000162 [Vezdaea acicularis]|nr:MAG: hypothetical protein M1824_000162 [Vezdaea acicularis]
METYHGHVRTPADAIILFEACRLGRLPRVQRRLSEKERQSIRSGSVFVWDESEAGMRRWTDGKSWSASRVSGSFLTYREMEGKRGGGGAFAPPTTSSRAGKTPDSRGGSESDHEMGEDGPDGYRYKPDGLMKQSFSITTSTNQHLHLISYYARSHPTAQGMNQPTNDPNLRHIRPQKGMYPESTIHEQSTVPVVTRGPMSNGPYAPSPHQLPAPGPAGYGRPPYGQYPAQPMPGYQVPPQGYQWPQSSLPPNPYAPNPYGQMQPNGSVGNSPLQYQSGLVPPTGHPQNPYDGPPPTSLPPGPPSIPRRSSPLPVYIPNPSPRVAQSTILAQQAQQAAQHQQQQQQHHSQPPSLASSLLASASKIDPRLVSPLTNPPLRHDQNGTQTPPIDVLNPIRDPSISSNTIPSLGAMMKGPPSSSVVTDAADPRSAPTSRQSSRSPGGSKKPSGPKDIPNEKLVFAEDTRAIRVLDRGFRA